MESVNIYKDGYIVYSGWVDISKLEAKPKGKITSYNIWYDGMFIGVVAGDRYERIKGGNK